MKPLKLALIAAGVFVIAKSRRGPQGGGSVNAGLVYSGGAPSPGGGLTNSVSLSTDSRMGISPVAASPDSFMFLN